MSKKINKDALWDELGQLEESEGDFKVKMRRRQIMLGESRWREPEREDRERARPSKTPNENIKKTQRNVAPKVDWPKE